MDNAKNIMIIYGSEAYLMEEGRRQFLKRLGNGPAATLKCRPFKRCGGGNGRRILSGDEPL